MLGWSNAAKIRAHEETIERLQHEIFSQRALKAEIEADQKKNTTLRQQLAILLSITDYSRIDWKGHMEQIHLLEKERHELLNNNDLLSELHKKKDEVVSLIAEVQGKETEKNRRIGKLEGDILSFQNQLKDLGETILLVSNQLK